MNKEIFNELFIRYPQIGLPVKKDMKNSELYKDTVLRGKPLLSVVDDFSDNNSDYFQTEETPAGAADILFLENRQDFETAIRKLANKCEPAEIPASMGASTISGLINWKKINDHKEDYLKSGGSDWISEFNRFTSDKEKYKGSIILLSSGEYSAVDREKLMPLAACDEGFILTDDEWKRKSVTIRKYHELTHFVCQRLYPAHKDAIRDEVIADAAGIIAAFGNYNIQLAKIFLGIENEVYREGGRLQNYYFDNAPKEIEDRARKLVEITGNFLSGKNFDTVYQYIDAIEQNSIGIF